MSRFLGRPLGVLAILVLALVVMFAAVTCSSQPAAAPAKEPAKAAAPAKEAAKPAAPAQEAAKPTAAAKEAAKAATPAPAAKSAELAVPKEKVTIKLAHNMPINNQIQRGAELLAKKANELSKGQITVEVYPAGQLYNDSNMVEAVGTSSVQLGIVTADLLAAEVPGSDIFSQPFLFSGFNHLKKALEGPMGQKWRQGVEAKGFHAVAMFNYGTTNTGSNPRQLKNPEDFKGLKMRAVGASTAEIFKAMGASPVYMGAGEVYTALQRNTIDGFVTSLPSIVDRKFYEVTKYGQVNNLSMGVFPVLSGTESWKKFSPETQKILEAAGKEAADYVWGETVRLEDESVKTMKEKGMDVYAVPESAMPAYQKATAPALDAYTKKAGNFGQELIKLVQQAK